MMTINQMETMFDYSDVYFLPGLFKHLNGGIVLLAEAKLNPYGRHQDLYILGENQACRVFRRMVKFFDGSPLKTHARLTSEQTRRKFISMVKHDFQPSGVPGCRARSGNKE